VWPCRLGVFYRSANAKTLNILKDFAYLIDELTSSARARARRCAPDRLRAARGRRPALLHQQLPLGKAATTLQRVMSLV
jgi:hypothetical protein